MVALYVVCGLPSLKPAYEIFRRFLDHSDDRIAHLKMGFGLNIQDYKDAKKTPVTRLKKKKHAVPSNFHMFADGDTWPGSSAPSTKSARSGRSNPPATSSQNAGSGSESDVFQPRLMKSAMSDSGRSGFSLDDPVATARRGYDFSSVKFSVWI